MQFPFQVSIEKEFDCVGFGENTVDYVLVAPHFPQPDIKLRLDAHHTMAGGQIASTMVALGRLGARAAYCGRFGSDAEGTAGRDSLRVEGVDTRFAETLADARTHTSYIIVDRRTGERTILWNRDERLNFRVEEAPIEFATTGRVLHIDGHEPLVCTRLAEAARATGTIVSADFDHLRAGLPELLPLIDILISSQNFPGQLTGITDERTALTEIKLRYGCPLVGITLGERGSLLLCGDVFLDSPAFTVPGGCRDTTGAGDAFHAGFIYGMLRGETIETSSRIANATASLSCRALGARQALPSPGELTELLGVTV